MEPIVNDSTADLPSDELTDKDRLDRYKMEIQLYETEYKPWEKRAQKIVKRYKDERAATQTSPTRFNVLYSNVQTLGPAAYGSEPKPDIQRRYKDDDVLGRVSADVLERCATFFVKDKFGDTLKKCLQDRLLPGRGVSWVRYVPHIQQSVSITDEVYEEVTFEEVCHDYVYWKDFGHNVCRIWPEVYLVWKCVYLDKDELIERFGEEIAKLCPMDHSPRGLSDDKKDEVMKKSIIYEMWDKRAQKVVWVHKDVDQFLDIKDDPLGLPDFFPCPKPLFAVLTNDSLVPVPDYVEYQDQAVELDELTSRISAITKSIKVVGVYDASAPGIERMMNEGVENRLIAVEQWALLGEKGGIKGVVQFMPIQEIAEVLLRLYEARDKVKADLYEITGISDIIRGATKASETATAQNIKSNFANLRLDSLQHSVARFAREMVVSTALIIAKHFSLDTIKQISGVKLMTAQEKQQYQMMQQQAQMQAQQAQAMGQQPPPPPPPPSDEMQELLDNPTWEEVYQLFQDQAHLLFDIDIETDSTIKADEQEDQQARIQLITAAGQFIQQAAQVQQPELVPLLGEILLFGVRGFKIGKSIEAQFRIALKKIEKKASEPQPPKPDPDMARIEADKQADAAKLQADQQANQMKLQSNQQIAQQQMALDERKHQMQLQADSESDQRQAALDLVKHNATLASQQQIASKPTTQLQLSSDGEIAQIADAINQTTQSNVEAINAALMQMQKSSEQNNAILTAAVQTLAAPKAITLDNGRTATVTPKVG